MLSARSPSAGLLQSADLLAHQAVESLDGSSTFNSSLFDSSIKGSSKNKDATEQQESFTRITDITLSPTSSNFAFIVAPIIRSLSRLDEDRWITWIGAGYHRAAHKSETMRKQGLSCHRFRMINAATDADCLWATWEALAMGNSQLVVSQLSAVREEHLQHLQHAAELGQCHSLLLTRHAQSPTA